MTEIFHTIGTPTSGEYKEKGSKFLAFAYPVESEDDVKECLENLRKEFYDARHHCYGYILGTSEQATRANDDGEPNHSAGDPILGQIKSFELTNCLVVVVRYFGGTKLGVGGLIQAYKEAANEALVKAVKKRIIETHSVKLKFNYDQMGTVERWLEDFPCTEIQREYTTSCILSFEIEISKWPELRSKIEENHLIEQVKE
ncbi:MAG: YigZ family protein [Cyclobacteriaceae bacterium]